MVPGRNLLTIQPRDLWEVHSHDSTVPGLKKLTKVDLQLVGAAGWLGAGQPY